MRKNNNNSKWNKNIFFKYIIIILVHYKYSKLLVIQQKTGVFLLTGTQITKTKIAVNTTSREYAIPTLETTFALLLLL